MCCLHIHLSKLGLTCPDLPVKLLSRLWSLERWDLSGNKLQEFPKSLELPELRFLDLSDNQMEDVTSLASLRSLEEVKMEDNLYITVSDNYKLMTLLPKLRSYNGKDITSTANHVRFVFTENLRTRINALWRRSYNHPDPLAPEKTAVLEEDFVNAAQKQVKYGPSSVSDFTKWKKSWPGSICDPSRNPRRTCRTRPILVIDAVGTLLVREVPIPAKRKRAPVLMDDDLRLTPRKRAQSDPSLAEDDLEKRTIGGAGATFALTPSRARARGKAAGEGTAKSGVKEKTRDEATKSINKMQPVCLQPLHVLQCHSKEDNPQDFSTQLWDCAFQPQPDFSGSRLVATCGGESLCVIECETGAVMKKYRVAGEEFFSLAWSTVLMSRGGGALAQPVSILAAGGKRGLVKLIHPRCNVAYGELRVSRKALSVLRFDPRQGNFLFTGCYDNRIVLWDIGGLDSEYKFKALQLLALESVSTPLHICLPPSGPDAQLLAACEDGLHLYDAMPAPAKRSDGVEITFPIYEKEDIEHNYRTVDGIAFLAGDVVASKNFTHDCIYLWSWSQTRSQRPDESGRVRAVVLAKLRWAQTEIPYLALNTCPGRSYVVCGDHEGKLWTYHVADVEKEHFHGEEPVEPTEVLRWPAPVREGLCWGEGPSINSVAMDPDLWYLVALSDKNVVTVWKRAA
ncbi:leucine-rich repeat and WD repeat-containing protein 1 isoform X2 [Syngnathus acus]|uniref:leucine-rich repeat and WD repeat-containing protein 1 isoform X2 n=1 Tax=Syngnathus acus TaxID=161584 RepID=UPI0018861EDB|nr:leucine-rich repeat and WD repeat-containing protein 1 isoform X2 [Syngnathus acus]